MECFRLLFDHLASVEHEFLSGIRDSRKVGSLWAMMRGVGGVRKSIHQSWLDKFYHSHQVTLVCPCTGIRKRTSSSSLLLQVYPTCHLNTPELIGQRSTWTMNQSTTPSLSQTIWARWAFLYHSNIIWKAPSKSSCVSVTMTFVTVSFISSTVS